MHEATIFLEKQESPKGTANWSHLRERFHCIEPPTRAPHSSVVTKYCISIHQFPRLIPLTVEREKTKNRFSKYSSSALLRRYGRKYLKHCSSDIYRPDGYANVCQLVSPTIGLGLLCFV